MKKANPIRVLIVDDDLSIRRLLRKVMEIIGVEDVIITNDGLSALRIFAELKPDVVFTDYLMPEMNGIELIHQMKKQKSRTPVVLYTGKYDKWLQEKIKEEEFRPDFVLQKPQITLENLTNIMEECFPQEGFRKRYEENIKRITEES